MSNMRLDSNNLTYTKRTAGLEFCVPTILTDQDVHVLAIDIVSKMRGNLLYPYLEQKESQWEQKKDYFFRFAKLFY